MSYDIELIDPVTEKTIHLDKPHQMKGGIFALGGTTEASLNVTYNYAVHYDSVGPEGIRSIYGKTGAESIPILKESAASLADNADSDYWKATEGNAKKALLQLIALASMRPDGIWSGD